jgi:hypothetical protein
LNELKKKKKKKKKLDIQYINTNYNQYQFQNKSTTITKSQQQSTITKKTHFKPQNPYNKQTLNKSKSLRIINSQSFLLLSLSFSHKPNKK